MSATATATNNTDDFGWFHDIETPTEIVVVEYRIIPSSRVYVVKNRVVSLLSSPPVVEMAATRIETQHPTGVVQAVAKQVNGQTIIPVDNAILYDASEPEPMEEFERQRQRDCVKFSIAILLVVSIISTILSFV